MEAYFDFLSNKNLHVAVSSMYRDNLRKCIATFTSNYSLYLYYLRVGSLCHIPYPISHFTSFCTPLWNWANPCRWWTRMWVWLLAAIWWTWTSLLKCVAIRWLDVNSTCLERRLVFSMLNFSLYSTIYQFSPSRRMLDKWIQSWQSYL